jgi:putative sigma-54 modulation protein
MKVTVTFRHMPSSDALREYARDKVTHVVEKYFRASELEAHVVLSVERFWHVADFTIGFRGTTVKVEERSEDMYSSIDLAMDKIERQVRRYKSKLREHKGGATLADDALAATGAEAGQERDFDIEEEDEEEDYSELSSRLLREGGLGRGGTDRPERS